MPLPVTADNPPFDITRASHVVLNVTDLDRSRRFYEQLIGLVVTTADDDTVYLRGVEEVCHHSLILQRTSGSPTADRIGMRVRSEADIDLAQTYLTGLGLPAKIIEVPFQGKTLLTTDTAGIPLELCSRMDVLPRFSVPRHEYKGAAPPRFDHYQVHVTDPESSAAFYTDLGFRISEFATLGGGEDEPLLAAFLTRKNNANDLVMLPNEGPRLHHFAFVTHDTPSTMLRVGDLADSLGMADAFEFGPGRHGLGDELFLYLRDPDGHRCEVLSFPYQFMDAEELPTGWSIQDTRIGQTYGAKPSERWFSEASHFDGVPTALPAAQRDTASVVQSEQLKQQTS